MKGGIKNWEFEQTTTPTETKTCSNKICNAEHWLSTCVINLGTFLCRPLQKNENDQVLSDLSKMKEDGKFFVFLSSFIWNGMLSLHI